MAFQASLNTLTLSMVCVFGKMHFFGRNRETILDMLYSVDRVHWLALYLSQPHSRLNYRKPWSTGNARAIAAGVWVFACELAHEATVRVQKEIECFLNTSPLTCCKRLFIKVPARDTRAVAIVKRQVACMLKAVRNHSLWWSIMLACKIKVVRSKPLVLSDTVLSSVQFAKRHDAACLAALTVADKTRFDKRLDVNKSGLFWDIPLEHDNVHLQQLVLEQFETLVAMYKIGHVVGDFAHMIFSTSYVSCSVDQTFLQVFVREEVGDCLVVAADKDPKRRV